MTSLTEFFSATNPVVDPLWHDIRDFIRRKSAANPRGLQRELGPSEVGHPCLRKLAFGLMQIPRCNPEYDPLPSIFGVAMHAWLQDAAEYDNEQLGRRRWITETRVEVTPGLSGTADLYDTDTDTVVDYKNLGYTSFVKKVKDAGSAYKGQIQMYGRGFRNAGLNVKRVAICMLPRSGTLSKMHMEPVPYDDGLVNEILARRETVIELLDEFDVEAHPERYQWFSTAPEECMFCAWWSPEPKGPMQCGGKPA